MRTGFADAKRHPNAHPHATTHKRCNVPLLPLTHGCNSFTLSLELSPPVLSVAVRNKLLIFRWDGAGFGEWKELEMPDVVTQQVACGDSLCIAAGKRYMILNLTTGAHKDLFDSNTADPTAFCLPVGSSAVGEDKRELLLGRDCMSVFQDSSGRPSRKYGITWTEPASRLLYLAPYILGVLPKVVEVKLLDNQTTVQSLSLRAAIVTAAPDSFAAFVVANNCVYRLRPVAITRQIDALLEAEQYDTALALCERCANSDPAVAAKAPAVYRAHGLTLFAKLELDKAMDLLARCPPSTLDPRHVLNLFPDLAVPSTSDLPPEHDDPPTVAAKATAAALKGHKLLRAQVHLIKYLRRVRQRIRDAAVAPSSVNCEQFAPGAEGLVDTAMLKALVRAEPENVLAFLQTPNCCDLNVAEDLLVGYDMWHELVALLQTHRQHRRALELLAAHGQGDQEGHALHGVMPTVEYIRALGAEEQALVLEFSRWVLRANPEAALRIFCEPAEGVKPLAAGVVLEHLKPFDEDEQQQQRSRNAADEHEPGLRIAYLEYVVTEVRRRRWGLRECAGMRECHAGGVTHVETILGRLLYRISCVYIVWRYTIPYIVCLY